jgi:hypothetical protein
VKPPARRPATSGGTTPVTALRLHPPRLSETLVRDPRTTSPSTAGASACRQKFLDLSVADPGTGQRGDRVESLGEEAAGGLSRPTDPPSHHEGRFSYTEA